MSKQDVRWVSDEEMRTAWLLLAAAWPTASEENFAEPGKMAGALQGALLLVTKANDALLKLPGVVTERGRIGLQPVPPPDDDEGIEIGKDGYIGPPRRK